MYSEYISFKLDLIREKYKSLNSRITSNNNITVYSSVELSEYLINDILKALGDNWEPEYINLKYPKYYFCSFINHSIKHDERCYGLKQILAE